MRNSTPSHKRLAFYVGRGLENPTVSGDEEGLVCLRISFAGPTAALWSVMNHCFLLRGEGINKKKGRKETENANCDQPSVMLTLKKVVMLKRRVKGLSEYSLIKPRPERLLD